MQLPVKFVPEQSHHLGSVVGAAITFLMGLAFMAGYLPDRRRSNQPAELGEWVGASGVRLPFL